jgi:cob(I)alamin adenosyltransferase
MIKLNKIYTRTGDDGTTGLVIGPRRSKADVRIAAVGAVDEANAVIGIARAVSHGMMRITTVLGRIQNDMFDVGADLATPGDDSKFDTPPLRVADRQVEWLEKTIDQFNRDLEPLSSFVLPGGSLAAAHLHAARTVVRRAERAAVALAAAETDTSPAALRYLNRLSDLMFVLARSLNDYGQRDVLWVPGLYATEDEEPQA